jgi:hypothetical protein
MKKIILLLFCISIFASTTINANPIGNRSYSSLEIKYPETPNIALGQKIPIGIVAMTDKGKEFKTPGFLAPGLLKTAEWADFTIAVTGGTFSEGAVTISSNLSEIKNYEVKITASSVKNPEVKTELIIKLNFKGTTVAAFDGVYGKGGRQGAMGAKGPNAVTSSDQAGAAGMGGPGGQGGNGGPGQNIEVYAKLQFDARLNKEMLYVLVKSKTSGQQQLFLVDPDGGKIIVTANGGEGGSGGYGGQGGAGGDDTYRTSSTNGGQGGSGGNGGNGGDGGTIVAFMDPGTDKLGADVIKFSNEGGVSGQSGPGGSGGFKGYYPNATNGPQGTQGASGNPGTKGPAIKIVKQKVEIDATKAVSASQTAPAASSTDTEEAPDTASPSSASSTTAAPDVSKLPAFDKKKPGYFEEKYDNGKIEKQGYKINGKMEGESREFVSNTKGTYLFHYKNNLKEGYAVEYGFDGSLKAEGYYKNDMMDGEWKYYKKGVLVETVTFVEGVQQ